MNAFYLIKSAVKGNFFSRCLRKHLYSLVSIFGKSTVLRVHFLLGVRVFRLLFLIEQMIDYATTNFYSQTFVIFLQNFCFFFDQAALNYAGES